MLVAKPNITYPAQLAALLELEKSQEYNRFIVHRYELDLYIYSYLYTQS